MGLPAGSSSPYLPTRYNESYLNIAGRFSTTDIIKAVVRSGSGTVLMSGPPGTGKTQLATHMANRLGRELLYYTASDINAKWFGESERNVAGLFSACDAQRQLIFLDEAETLLGAREQAMHRGAEAVTAEFLRQLEHISGVFLCATNHAGSFDSALVRRFTFRLQFRPLSQQQREMMLRELVAWPEGQPLPVACLRHLEQLDGLTPGDFAIVGKRFRLLGHAAVLDDWLCELADEWKAKPGNEAGRPVGFV
jgi:AAA+ superfamily predicted ATPase